VSFTPDSVSWALESSGRGASVAKAKDIWELATPLKLNIFIWEMARGRLPSSEMIKKRHGPSDGICILCAQPKDVAHIFFNCPLARFMWSGLRSIF
jgi:hypothetical protein